MTRKIKYKLVSKELENLAKPTFNSSTRTGVGLDQAVGEYYFIATDQLSPFKHQARKSFNKEDMTKLADSIKEYGILQPLSVLKDIDGQYVVISGERRLRAAKQAGLDKAPCILLKENKDADVIALIQNIHRKDLHPIELGSAYKQLIESKVFDNQEALSQAISVGKSTISECIKLSYLPEDIKQQAVAKNIDSRAQLRGLIKAYEDQNIEKMRSIAGLTRWKQMNFSVIRIVSSAGEIKVQSTGIAKLSVAAKKLVTSELEKLIHQIDVM